MSIQRRLKPPVASVVAIGDPDEAVARVREQLASTGTFTDDSANPLVRRVGGAGSGKPLKCRVRPPCLNYVQAVPEMTIGHYLADIVPIFGSINMIGGELER